MELQKNTEVKSTTHYWGYRELTAAELLLVSGGEDGGGDGGNDGGGHGDADNSFDSSNYRYTDEGYVFIGGRETMGDR
jgi:hypothetical protein